MAEGEAHRGRLLTAVVTFVVVAGIVFLTGTFVTFILRRVVLPVLAVLLGWFAARVAYRMRD